jgi:flagellar motor protein MotB
MHNPWIPIADLLSGFVVVVLLLFVSAAILPRLEKEAAQVSEEQRRTAAFADLRQTLAAEEAQGIIAVDVAGRTIELKDVSFEPASACLSPAAAAAVAKIAPAVARDLEAEPGLEVHLEGHTDPIPVARIQRSCGVFGDNTQLSALRAANVREQLLASAPAGARARMPVTGRGPDRLRNTVEPTAPENRRVELRWSWTGQAPEQPAPASVAAEAIP